MSEGSPFSCVLDARARLGESPVWSVAEQVLYWVDIKGRTLNRFDPATGANKAMAMPEDIGSVALVEGGGFIAAMRSGLFLVDTDGRVRERLAANPEDPAVSRFNDGRTDPAGRFLVGTIDEPKAGGQAHLYRFDERGLVPLVGGLLTSNGLAFSPDSTWLYHSDTPAFTIYRQRYDIETGTFSDREEWVRLTPTEDDRGRPDGAAVDIEGCYWTALYEGGRIQRYSPQGELLAEFPVPARCPTMVAFGGADLKTLFVTSARDGRPDDELAHLPQSGGIFAMRVSVPGLPEPLFRRPVP
ncbi:SMP-30/gluconolactonase/LRE family protein [Chelatococcus composti]|jgi:sugar lactone lactonase YvrE|uniref:Sugar lactone lactonase YvrE n=1 Tax=Chelatococcus composti TaxID=1743235 RepID=A0A841K7B2_9HYPH|nr:SMP-30/gluconolactonase/LRE family protein [Chelatococcus composti]MBB6167342.1 sugar lactone lactonase YvrE [Chelatococcus composti]MBS7735549.1 SMP-30/gluconolactonase/LRE family protein [Chelatococcus composti]GGG31143.1 gluconolactonase [Chelatococcus composti]